MAKLDKAQQKYAMDRVEELYRRAVSVKVAVNNITEIKEKLDKAGIILDDYYIKNCKLRPTAKQKQDEEKLVKKNQEYRDMADSAKDQIMLGDSEEVTKILADLAKKLV